VTLPDGHQGLAKATVMRLPARDLRSELTVVVAKETDALERLERRLHWIMALVATATLLAGLAAVRYAVRRGLRPVQRLAQQIAQIDPRAPHRIALATGPLPDELEPLAEKTLSILDRLLAALERERRFSRNVAHELRTPLAEVRMLADVGAMAQTTDETQASLVEIGATAAELQRIIDSLLTLARYEAGTEKPQIEPVDLARAVRRELERAAPVAEQRDLTVDAQLPPEYWILADATLLHRLIANLVGNAVAHAPVGSLITMTLQPDGSLFVANPAPHLDANAMSRLGERFFRVDSGDRGSHAGLGLSLSEAIAGVLGLRLELRLDGSGVLVAALSGFERLEG
jgi:two-component system sensor histidine kinase QseC